MSAIAPGQSFWVALEFDIRDGWHTYWRNPGDSGQATQARLAAAAGIHGGRHRLDHAASLRDSAPGQLRLCQARGASGQHHRAQGLEGRRAGRAVGQGELAGLFRCLHSRRRRSAIALPVNAHGRRRRSRRTRRCSRPRAANCRARNWPRPQREIEDGQLVISLGKEWGATLPQIKSLAFFPYDDGGIEYAAPQTLTRAHRCGRAGDEAGLSAAEVRNHSRRAAWRPNRAATTW